MINLIKWVSGVPRVIWGAWYRAPRALDRRSVPRVFITADAGLLARHTLTRLVAFLCALAAIGLFAPAGMAADDMPGRDKEDPLATLPGAVTAGADHTIKRWDMSGRLAAVIGTHDDEVNAIAFVPGSGGNTLVSAGADGRLKIWAVQTATLLRSIDTHHGAVTALTLSSDGRLAATGGTDQYIRLWNVANGRLMAEVKAHADAVLGLAFTHDGARLVSGSADRLIRIWNIGPGGRTIDYHSNIQAHDDAITGIALTADDVIISVSADGFLKTWDPNNGSLIVHTHAGMMHNVRALALSPDGKTAATGDEDGKIRLWNITTGMPLPFMGSHDRAVEALAWTPDGAMLVSGSADKTVRYWNVATAHQMARVAAHDGSVKAIAIAP